MAKFAELDTVERALAWLGGNPRVVVSGNAATPQAAVDLIDRSMPQATINVLNAIRPMPERDGIVLETSFVGPGMRNRSNLRYVPCRLSMVPVLFRFQLPPDVVIVHTSLPKGDQISLGIEVNVLPAAIAAARARGGIVIALANQHMPFTSGDAIVDLADVDYLVEIDEPLISVEPAAVDDASGQIGSLIGEHIHDGATLQLGIGAVPDAVLQFVQATDLRIWTETFSDGVLTLERDGVLDPNVPIRTSFLIGSHELYEWADDNPRLHLLRTEVSNDPAQIARNHAMTSINAALQVDLYGQANASRVKGRIYSGFGGSTDFIVGAMHAPKGHSFMALPSWHPKADVSTIVDRLDVPATSFQQSAVVTEQGVAWLFGVDEREQAHNLIEHAAHPDAREQLRRSANQLGH